MQVGVPLLPFVSSSGWVVTGVVSVLVTVLVWVGTLFQQPL